MAKYVCDYGQVIAAGEKLIALATDLSTATTTYASNTEADLSGWEGSAKSNFAIQCREQTDNTVEKANNIAKFGEFIRSSAQKIQELDDSLASIQI